MFLFVAQTFLIFIVRIWVFCCAIWVYLKSLNGSPESVGLFRSLLMSLKNDKYQCCQFPYRIHKMQ